MATIGLVVTVVAVVELGVLAKLVLVSWRLLVVVAISLGGISGLWMRFTLLNHRLLFNRKIQLRLLGAGCFTLCAFCSGSFLGGPLRFFLLGIFCCSVTLREPEASFACLGFGSEAFGCNRTLFSGDAPYRFLCTFRLRR